MNLNSSLQSMLDTPTKAFEVALRCFVADNLLCQYPDEQSLKDEIQKRIDAIKGTHIILSGKIASSNILSAKEWPSFWSNTLFSRNCFLNKEHTISHICFKICTVFLLALLVAPKCTFTMPISITKSVMHYHIKPPPLLQIKMPKKVSSS